ncbi:MAG TPA: hypothetical protein VGD65_20320 [Chryseosolibacter sp.]
MRVTIAFLILFSPFSKVLAQGGIVSAPYLEALVTTLNSIQGEQSTTQSTMSSVIASMEASEKQYKEAMTKATWLRNLQSAQRVVALIENLVCTSKDLNVKLAIAGQSCFYSFQYEMVLVKVQMSADYLGIILSSVSMTVAERAQLFRAATESFEQSQHAMVSLSNSIDGDIARAKLNQQVAKEVSHIMTFDRSKKQ